MSKDEDVAYKFHDRAGIDDTLSVDRDGERVVGVGTNTSNENDMMELEVSEHSAKTNPEDISGNVRVQTLAV